MTSDDIQGLFAAQTEGDTGYDYHDAYDDDYDDDSGKIFNNLVLMYLFKLVSRIDTPYILPTL